MLRRPLLALAVVTVVCLISPTRRADAQVLGTVGATGGVDPFSFYYGYYLPHQAAIAAQPTPLDTINQVTAARQFAAMSDRTGLYDPISPYGEEELDPTRPFSSQRGRERIARPQAFAVSTGNARGTGPALYYNRTARYFPHMRVGYGPNKNIGVTRRSGGGMGGGMGMPSMGGFGGPR